QLVRGKIISSSKGPHGGFFLSEKNKQKNVLDIIDNIDGLNKLNGCFLGLNECDATNPCPVHHIVVPFKNNILEKFRDITIMEFAQEISDKGTFLAINNIDPSLEGPIE
ncbi:MAG: Rrf2 family transcriptional regulator, partial [Lutibacter sp.]|nr:Rrf2 family transcriptional regulator [Lutibacter sp.]